MKSPDRDDSPAVSDNNCQQVRLDRVKSPNRDISPDRDTLYQEISRSG